MDDMTQNMKCDIEIKEEFSEDFIEIKNQNFQINQNANITNKTKNNCVQSKNQSPLQNTTLNHVEIKEEDFDDVEFQNNTETDPLLVENSNIDGMKWQKSLSTFNEKKRLHETHYVSKEPNQKLVKLTFGGRIATVEPPSTNSATLKFTKSPLNPNELVGSVSINKKNYLIPKKSLPYILPKSVQPKHIPITRNPPNSKLVDVSEKPSKERYIEWECPAHFQKDWNYLNKRLKKLGKIHITEIAKLIKDMTKDKKANLESSKKEWLVQYVSKIAMNCDESFLIFKQAYNIVRKRYNSSDCNQPHTQQDLWVL